MEPTTDTEHTPTRIYNQNAIWPVTFLGGPLAAGYLIAENFKAFNEPHHARRTWVYAIIATILIFGGVFLVPDADRIPRNLIPIVYTAIAYFVVQRFQGSQIAAHIEQGGQTFGWWRTISVSIVGALLIAIPVVGFALLESTTPEFPSTKSYGSLKHEISYNSKQLSVAEVDQLADAFTATTFFDEAVTKYVAANKVDNKYEVYISCAPVVATDPEACAPFTALRNDMQRHFPNNRIVFNLVVDDLNNVVKRLE